MGLIVLFLRCVILMSSESLNTPGDFHWYLQKYVEAAYSSNPFSFSLQEYQMEKSRILIWCQKQEYIEISTETTVSQYIALEINTWNQKLLMQLTVWTELPEFTLFLTRRAAFGKQVFGLLVDAGQRRMRNHSQVNLNNIWSIGNAPTFLTVENFCTENHFSSAGKP